MAWATYGPTAEVFRDFTQAGVTLYTFSGTPTEAGYGLSKTVWTAPDQFDYSEFDRRVLMLLGVNPDAYFFPRLYLHAPKWWSERHPDDVVLTDPGDGKPRPFIHSGGKPAPSWASEAWRRDTVAALHSHDRAHRSFPLRRSRHRLSPRLGHDRGMDDVGRQRERMGGLLARQRCALPPMAAREIRLGRRYSDAPGATSR